ncbi:MAG: MATE family efflux transporter [Clostridiales bacterium]|jgi:putative MATE family efflux protein|nr:MATE family efflux transporter [Clostridiales bacterium]
MTKSMTEGRPSVLIFNFVVPLMVSGTLQFFYTIADSAIVGRLIGVRAFAAVGATGFFYWLAVSAGLGLTQGFGVIFAQRFGAEDYAGLKRAYKTGFVLSLGIGAALSAAGALSAKPLLALFATPADILDMSALYLAIMLGGLCFSYLNNLLSATLRGMGDSRSPMIAAIVASAVNITLDIIAVVSFGWGVAGVAAATVFAQALSALICALTVNAGLRKLSYGNSADKKEFRGEAGILLDLGLPIAARSLVISLGGLALQYVVNGYGSVFIAGIAASWKLYGLLEVIGGAYEAATGTYVGQNFGARKMERVREGMKSSRAIVLAVSCVIAILIVIWGKSILGLLVSGEGSAEVIEIGKRQLNIMAAGLPSLYILLLYQAALGGLGNTRIAMAAGFMEMAARVICAFAFSRAFGEWGVYTAEVIGWPIAAFYLLLKYSKINKTYLTI